MKFKKLILFTLCILFAFNGRVSASSIRSDANDTKLILNNVTVRGSQMSMKIEPEKLAEEVVGVSVDSVINLVPLGTSAVDFTPTPSYHLSDNILYIKSIKDRHTLTIKTKDNEYNFIYKDNGQNGGSFEYIDKAHSPKEVIHVKLVGYFETALKGQKKYDSISGATGSAQANKNSDIKVMVAETKQGVLPKESEWVELGKSNIELDKGKTKIMLAEESGMKPKYNVSASSITLSGTPNVPSNYQVSVKLVDIYGREAESAPAWFSVVDIDNVFLDKTFENVNQKLKVSGPKVLYSQDPWYIAHFNEKKVDGRETFTVPKNINVWQGSKESGVYGALGLILPVKNANVDKFKGEYEKWEDRIPIQDFILESGTNLTLAYMKVYSGVNIVVKKGATLNLHDSSIYGKITVDGGTLRVNYDPQSQFTGDINTDNPNKLVSGTSIQGQIILNDGAVLENSYIYSNTNNLTDSSAALENIRPVVLVKGDAFIRGNVFVRGDESPTGTDRETGLAYRGQNALKIDGGSLTIDKGGSLYLYGGGVNATTSLGGNALELTNGAKVLGDGTLVAMGGTGHDNLGMDNVGGYAVYGNGSISTEKAYLRVGNGGKDKPQKAVSETVKIHNNVKGTVIDKADSTYKEYWMRSSIPLIVDSLISNTLINPSGDEKINSKPVPKGEVEVGGIKRVDFVSSDVYQKSIAIVGSDDDKFWLNKIANNEAVVKVGDEILNKSNSNSRGYHVEYNQFYATGLKLGEVVSVEVEGYIPVKLIVTKVNSFNEYNLQIYSQVDDEKLIEVPKLDTSDENVASARRTVNELVNSIDLGVLELKGIASENNNDSIRNFKNTVERARDLANRENLSEYEKEELIKFAQKENGKYVGFENALKYVKVNLSILGEKEVRNKHDNSKLHLRTVDGKVNFKTELENVEVGEKAELIIYRISKTAYDNRIDTLSGATPKFENELLDRKYYSIISKSENIYTIDIDEKSLLKDFPDTELLKCVFRVKLHDGIYAENGDFIFLSGPSQDGNNFNKTNLILQSEVDTTLPKNVNYVENITSESGHYEYRKVVVSGQNFVTEEVQGYINGYPDGTFKPENNVSRAEAANMVMKMKEASGSNDKPNFLDTDNSWYNKAINYATANGMLIPNGNSIRPDEAITRAEFARLIKPLLDVKKASTNFNDVKGNEFEDAVEIAAANKIVIGYPDGSFRPSNKITRAEAVTMINRISKKYLNENELKSKDIEGFTDVDKNHWAFLEIASAVNYNSVHKRLSMVPTSYESWEKVWVKDSNAKVEKKEEEYLNRILENVDNKLKVSGQIQKTAELTVENKITTKNADKTVAIPESAYEYISKSDKKFEILKSFRAYLNGASNGEMTLQIGVDAKEGETLKALHSNSGLEVSDYVVKNGEIILKVNDLNSFVVLREESVEDFSNLKELLAEKINYIKGLETEKYTANSIESLLEAAKRIESEMSQYKDKNEFEEKIKSLEDEIAKLILRGDKEKLVAEIEKARLSLNGEYTKESKQSLRTLLDKLNIDYKNADEKQIEDAIKTIRSAVQNLEKIKVMNKSVKFNTDYDSASSYAIKIDKDLDSKAWLEKVGSGSAKVFRNGEEISFKSNENKNGYEVNADNFSIGNLEENEKITVRLDGYSDVELKSIKNKWRMTVLALAEQSEPEISEEHTDSSVEKNTKKVVFIEKEIFGNFSINGIKVDTSDNHSNEWFENIRTGNVKITKDGVEIPKKEQNSEGYDVYSDVLKISGLKNNDVVKIEMDGFETVMLKAENDSWGIYHLVSTEEIKGNTATSENTVVNDVEKIKVTFEKPSMFATNYLRLNKNEQNKKWLESLENETANARTQSGKEIKKESLENTSGYKVDLYDFTISMRNMEIGEVIEIETAGYDKVVLKIVKDSFGSARLEIYE